MGKIKMAARNCGDRKCTKGGFLLSRTSHRQVFIHVTHNGLSKEGLLIVKQGQLMIIKTKITTVKLSTGKLLHRPAKVTSGRSLLLTEEMNF